MIQYSIIVPSSRRLMSASIDDTTSELSSFNMLCTEKLVDDQAVDRANMLYIIDLVSIKINKYEHITLMCTVLKFCSKWVLFQHFIYTKVHCLLSTPLLKSWGCLCSSISYV